MDEGWREAAQTEEMAAVAGYSSRTPAGTEEAVEEARTLYSPALPGSETTLVQSGRCTGGWQGAEQEQRAEWVIKSLTNELLKVILNQKHC